MPIFAAHSEDKHIRFGNGKWIRRFQRQRESWRHDVDVWLKKNPDHALKDWVKFGFAAHQVAERRSDVPSSNSSFIQY